MDGESRAVNPFPRHEIPFDVIQHLIRINVRVVVRGGNTVRVIVKQAWYERAHNESGTIKRLMNRRRLMDSTGNRFKVLDIESVRPKVTVPTHHVQWMMFERVSRNHAPCFNTDFELPRFVDRNDLLRDSNVTFAIRRVLKKLTVVVNVTLRRNDMPKSLGDQHSLRPRVGNDPPHDTCWNHQIISRPIGQHTELRFQFTCTFVNKMDFVTMGKTVPIRHRFGGTYDRNHAVLISHQRNPRIDRIATRRSIDRVQQTMLERRGIFEL